METDTLLGKLEKLTKMENDSERDKETELVLAYLDGVIAAEKDPIKILHLTIVNTVLDTKLKSAKRNRELNKKIDDLTPTLNGILERMGKLEKRFDDLDKGK